MTGQVTDPDRVKQLMAEQPDMRTLRPDILGTVSVGHEDGKWAMVIYFTSEAEAREGCGPSLTARILASLMLRFCGSGNGPTVVSVGPFGLRCDVVVVGVVTV
jgi:hypothetical protein